MDHAQQVTFHEEPSLESSDEFEVVGDLSTWSPTELLGTFTLLMAGQGRRVSSDMMLGDREYAMWQLARAHTMADDELRLVAARLFTHFVGLRGWGAALPA